MILRERILLASVPRIRMCFESLSPRFFMRNVNHFMKMVWINQASALESRTSPPPRFLGLPRSLRAELRNTCVIIFLRKQSLPNARLILRA